MSCFPKKTVDSSIEKKNSTMNQRINTLDFADCVVSIEATQSCRCNVKTPRDNTQAGIYGHRNLNFMCFHMS